MNGLMVVNILGIGTRENNMERECTLHPKERKSMENGIGESVLDGSKTDYILYII